MLRNLKKIVISILAVTGIIAFSSCNDEPTTMGSTLLYDTLNLQTISTTTDTLITDLSSVRFDFNFIDRGVFHVGISNGIKALSLLRFDEPLRFTDTLDYILELGEAQIISCKLKFVLPAEKYAIGDIENPTALSFKIYNIEKDWLSSKTKDTYESVQDLLDKSKVIAEFKGNITQNKVVDTIETDFDKGLIYNWLNTWKNTRLDSNYKNTNVIWGIGLVPDDNSTVIRSFQGDGKDNKPPYIELVYKNTSNELDTLIISEVDDKSYYEIPEYSKNQLMIQGGVSSRGLIKLDLRKIPPLSSVQIAELELTIDFNKSIFENSNMDKSFVWELPKDSNYYDLTKFDQSGRYSQWGYANVNETDSSKLTLNHLAKAIETINQKGGLGEIVIFPSGSQHEFKELDKTVFYGWDEPDMNKRPKLKIIYAKRPEIIR